MAAYVAIVLATLFAHVSCGLAPFITPCASSDNKCLKSSAQKAVPFLAAGIPELGVSPADPMTLDRVTANQAGLEMDFRNTVVKGLKGCQVLNLRRQGRKMNIDLKCSVTMNGKYKLGGRLLIMPINGEGKYTINIRDIVVKLQFEVSEKKTDGEPHWDIKSWRHTAEVLTGCDFKFENLFRGNKQLSDAVHLFANQNWKEIFQEISPPVVKAIVAKIVDEVNIFFKGVPMKELALD